MEEHITPLAITTHLLQHTLRSLCTHDTSQWVYAVFWRILPRNYPPPKWDIHGGAYDRSRCNRRNWILVWEDGFCNFAPSAGSAHPELTSSGDCPATPAAAYNSEFHQFQGLQPELFFKMSHEIYSYGEGLIGKVAADHGHKWVYNEPSDQSQINFLSAWHHSADLHPRTWEAHFQSGIKTIALIAVREGVVQLGAINKVAEDLSYVGALRKKFGYIESIPGALLPHPSSSSFPYAAPEAAAAAAAWQHFQHQPQDYHYNIDDLHQHHFTNNPSSDFNQAAAAHMKTITPSMSSLDAFLSKLPPVIPYAQAQNVHSYDSQHHHHHSQQQLMSDMSSSGLNIMGKITLKEEAEDHECEGSAATYTHHQHITTTSNWQNKTQFRNDEV
uniref:Transcription factor MYC/MYB N-terminal domain-containing protein n=1 Tax=Kalanchoe fedtschenkoi TaxID=63787 RepID=A0A7N0U2L0_KALFE